MAWKSVFGNWSVDSIVYARTVPPVNVVTGQNPFGGALSGSMSVQRPDLVVGVPVWIADPNLAGGWKINSMALSAPSTQLGNAAVACDCNAVSVPILQNLQGRQAIMSSVRKICRRELEHKIYWRHFDDTNHPFASRLRSTVKNIGEGWGSSSPEHGFPRYGV